MRKGNKMTIEQILPWITILAFLFGIAKWLINAASELTKTISKLNVAIASLGENFSSFKADAKAEHEKTRERLDDHETRIHSLEDWKKVKDGETI
jgi:hypothetical protein